MVIDVERDGGVAIATIDHPPANLIDGPFFMALLDILRELQADDDVRVLILRSADPDFFMMHGDVELLRHTAPPFEHSTEPNIAAVTFDGLRTGRLVTIGLLDGIARGGGCEVLCGTDLRFGSERALIGQPEVALGIIPGAGGTAKMREAIGRGRTLDILLTGRDVTAEELYAIGWLDRLVPSAELDAVALAAAHRIAAMPAESVAAVKRVVDAPPETALVVESNEVARLLAGGGHQDRMARFVEAGGQVRKEETTRMQSIIDDVLRGPTPT